LLLLLSVALIAAACTSNDDDDDDASETDQAQATEQGLELDEPEIIVLGEGDVENGEPAAILENAAAVFAAVSPAIVLVETPSGAATGIVIEGGFILTNASAVWPHATASVRMAGGAIVPSVTVIGVDRLVDVAILGPLPGSTTALALTGLEGPVIGSEVFLIGYASRDAAVIQPSISTGLVSGERRWEPGNVTFIQSDAPVGPEQVGGALVTDTGALVGLAGPRFGEDRISQFAAVADLRAQMEALLAGEGTLPIALTAAAEGSTNQVIRFSRDEAEQIYLINGEAGQELTVTLEGDQDGALTVFDATGLVISGVDATIGGLEILEAELVGAAPLMLVVENLQGLETEYELTTSLEVARFQDA
jgi:S1-C subfamily serine protease